MGELRIGSVLPSTGDLKLGSTNVIKIYNGQELVFGVEDFQENLGTSFNGTILVIAIQPLDNKILVGGLFSSFNGNDINRLVRLNPNGTEDINFSNEITPGVGSVNSEYRIDDIVVLPNGDILAGGRFTSMAGVNGITNLAKFNSLGELDLTFESNLPSLVGTPSTNPIDAIVPQSDGKILVTVDDRVIRLLSTGAPDTPFNDNFEDINNVNISFIYDAIQLLDGSFLIGGALSYNFTAVDILKLNNDGTLDTTFMDNLLGGFNGSVYELVEQPDDGKILVGGDFSSYRRNSTDTSDGLIRISPDGTPDTDFNLNLGVGFNGYLEVIRTICLQPLGDDYKILVGGSFETFNGNDRYKLVRLNSDGTEDVDFYNNLGTGFGPPSNQTYSQIFDIVIDNEGNILISATTTDFKGTLVKKLIKLDSDGNIV